MIEPCLENVLFFTSSECLVIHLEYFLSVSSTRAERFLKNQKGENFYPEYV